MWTALIIALIIGGGIIYLVRRSRTMNMNTSPQEGYPQFTPSYEPRTPYQPTMETYQPPIYTPAPDSSGMLGAVVGGIIGAEMGRNRDDQMIRVPPADWADDPDGTRTDPVLPLVTDPDPEDDSTVSTEEVAETTEATVSDEDEADDATASTETADAPAERETYSAPDTSSSDTSSDSSSSDSSSSSDTSSSSSSTE